MDNKLFIVSKAICDGCFTVCNNEDEAEAAIERANEFYTKDAENYRFNLEHYPAMADDWQRMLEKTETILAGGFEAVGWEEYLSRQKKHWLTNVKEETIEEWDYALCVLPPLDWQEWEDCSFFFMSEFLTMTFTTQHYRDKETGKYYCATVDYCDKSTWIHNQLKNSFGRV